MGIVCSGCQKELQADEVGHFKACSELVKASGQLQVPLGGGSHPWYNTLSGLKAKLAAGTQHVLILAKEEPAAVLAIRSFTAR